MIDDVCTVRWLIVGLCVLSLGHAPVEAANYYVATNGSNSNPGTLAQPFLTIQQAAYAAHAGDNVYVRGGTYRETVTAMRSGTASAPITYQPYQNEQVMITGLDPLNSGWTQYSGSIYSATLSSFAVASQVFLGGNLMGVARWPNAGYNNPLVAKTSTVTTASPQSPPTASTITDTALNGTPDGTWTGATMAITAGAGWTVKTPSVAQTGNTLSFQTNGDSWSVPAAGNRYFLYDKLVALNAPGEWLLDSGSGSPTLYLQTLNGLTPNGQNVEIRNRQYGFDLRSQSYVNVQGFRLKGASINIGGDHNLIDNCQVLYADPASQKSAGEGYQRSFEGASGVTISGQYNTITHSEIGYTGGNGVTIGNATHTATNNTVTNNIIHDVGWSGNESGFIFSGNAGGNNTFTNNTMYNSGRSGINLGSTYSNGSNQNDTVAHNDISRYAYLTADTGGIYAFAENLTGTTIAYNRVHDSRMSDFTPGWLEDGGIYIDEFTSGATVHHNLVTGAQIGIYVKGDGHQVYNNTLWDVDNATATANTGYTNLTMRNNLSNNGNWVGNTVDHNRYQTANQFTNSAAGDYTLTANSTGTNTGPTRKRAVDYGTPIAGITDGYTGSAPDAGAFEQGVTPWTAGANWKTWTAGNQASAPLDAALYVTQSGTRVTTGSLMVGNTTSTSANNRSFLQFDLSGVVSTTIASAVLRIYENTLPTSDMGSVTLNRVTSAWTNATVSYDQSVDTVTPITGFYDPANLDLYTDINITAWAQGWLSNSATNYGLRLSGTENVVGTAKYFDGFYEVTAPQLVLTFAEPGDVNLDGKVDVSDLAILAANYRKNVTGGWAQADFNYDGVVNVQDLAILAANYRHGVASGVVPAYDGLDAEAIKLLSLAGVTVVPEPGTLALLATGLLRLIAYAWRKHRSQETGSFFVGGTN